MSRRGSTESRSKLVDSSRRGRVEDEARVKLGMRPTVIDDESLRAIAALTTQTPALELVAALTEEQRTAVTGRVIEERRYDELAASLGLSEQVVRKRVSRYLPQSAGCVISVLRADVTGTGRKDLVILYSDLGFRRKPVDGGVEGFTLEVVRPGGMVMRTSVRADPFPWITRVGNVNEIPGDELVLHLDDISSGDTYGIYTFRDGRIELARPLLSAGGDSADKDGFACEKLGDSATVTSQTIVLVGPTIHGRWRWTVTQYAWHGAVLRRSNNRTFVRRGYPGKAITTAGGLCGRPTDDTQAKP